MDISRKIISRLKLRQLKLVVAIDDMKNTAWPPVNILV